jgi:Periplasmic protein involved in polysaccharide export
MNSRRRWLTLGLAVAALAFLLAPVALVRAQTPDASYIIGPEDVLEVQVWDNKDLNQVVFVRPDGKTSLPLIGEIQAGGRTVQQLQDDLVKAYSRTIKVPSVTVLIKEIKSRPVYFIGGFGRPGPMQLTRNDMTLLEATAMIGGVAPTADAEKGFILRAGKKIPLNFEKLQKGDVSQDLKLEPFDKIVVPLAELVYVQGEVKAPGAIKYTTDLTLAKAITQVGGTTPLAAPGRVELLRSEGDKKVRMRIDLDKILRSPEGNPDVKLRPEDIIFVPQRLF